MWNRKSRGKKLMEALAQNKESKVSVEWPYPEKDDMKDEAKVDPPSTAQPAPKKFEPFVKPESDKLYRLQGETVDEFIARRDAMRRAEQAAKNPTGQAVVETDKKDDKITQIPTNPVRDAHNPNGTVGMPAKAGSPPKPAGTAGSTGTGSSYKSSPSHTTYKPKPPQEDSLFADLDEKSTPPTNQELSSSLMKALRDMEDSEERENCRLILEEAERAMWDIWKEWKPREEARKEAEKEAAAAAKLEEENRKRNTEPPPPPVGIPPRGEIKPEVIENKGPFWESPYATPKKSETPVSTQK